MLLLPCHDKITKKEADMAEVSYVSEQDFKSEVLESTLPVLVDFTAVWCGPCKMVDPIIKQLAVEWDGKVKVVKCDADQNPNVLMQYGIMGIPTVMLFKAGKMVERSTGYMPKDKLVSKISPHF
jgi:thioredoxin 1